MFFIPSDPDFGGYKFQIAKVELGESPQMLQLEKPKRKWIDKENIKKVTLVSENY
jgi:hypothetical protein